MMPRAFAVVALSLLPSLAAAADHITIAGISLDCRLVNDALGKTSRAVRSGYRPGDGLHASYINGVLAYDKRELGSIDQTTQLLTQVKDDDGNPVNCGEAAVKLDALRKALVSAAKLNQAALAPCTSLVYFDSSKCVKAANASFIARGELVRPLHDFHEAIAQSAPECALQTKENPHAPLFFELGHLPCSFSPMICKDMPLLQAAADVRSAGNDDLDRISGEPLRSMSLQVQKTLHKSDLYFRSANAHPYQGDFEIFSAVEWAMRSAEMLNAIYNGSCIVEPGQGVAPVARNPLRPVPPVPRAAHPIDPVPPSQPIPAPPTLVTPAPPRPAQPTSYPAPAPPNCDQNGCALIPSDENRLL